MLELETNTSFRRCVNINIYFIGNVHDKPKFGVFLKGELIDKNQRPRAGNKSSCE